MPLINVPTCWYHFMYGVSLTFVVMSKVLFMQNILSELIFSPNLNAPCKKKSWCLVWFSEEPNKHLSVWKRNAIFTECIIKELSKKRTGSSLTWKGNVFAAGFFLFASHAWMYLGQCWGVKLGRSIAQLGSVRSLSQEVPRLIFSGSTACLIFPPIHPAVVLNACRMERWWSEGLGRCIVALSTARTTSVLWNPFTKAMATSVFNRFWSLRWVLGSRRGRGKVSAAFCWVTGT